MSKSWGPVHSTIYQVLLLVSHSWKYLLHEHATILVRVSRVPSPFSRCGIRHGVRGHKSIHSLRNLYTAYGWLSVLGLLVFREFATSRKVFAPYFLLIIRFSGHGIHPKSANLKTPALTTIDGLKTFSCYAFVLAGSFLCIYRLSGGQLNDMLSAEGFIDVHLLYVESDSSEVNRTSSVLPLGLCHVFIPNHIPLIVQDYPTTYFEAFIL